MPDWSIQDSEALYGIRNWGHAFVRTNDSGNLTLAPRDGLSADLHKLVSDLQERGIQLPLLLRFPDLLHSRIRTIATAFSTAIEEYGYSGSYRGVYPIKVNQTRHLVEEVVRVGRPWHLGLEAGSKPELLVVLAMLDDPEAVIVCNGYKDKEYIETAILAQKLGRRPIIVVEKASEARLCVTLARKHKVRPILGVRSKLAHPGAGRWKTSTGDKAKFGLTILEMVQMVDYLDSEGMLDTLQLLHFHIGSQVSAIRSFKSALAEASRIFVELHELGAPMKWLDVGGGLGVDYNGSSTNDDSSMNYSVQEYAYDVVAHIQSACDQAGVPHPDIITEAGRAMVAHHAVLVFDVLGVSSHPTSPQPIDAQPDDPEVLHELAEMMTEPITPKNYQAAWHDVLGAREQALSMFNLGLLDLRQRARAERTFWQLAGRIADVIDDLQYVPNELARLRRVLADTFFCNFSVFQSMPDAWAIDQLFPVLPIHRLNEEPKRRGVLADITCDSDGKLDRFIDRTGSKPMLALHDPGAQPYFLAAFLVGAYQEILGDLHNLFGDTNTVIVRLLEGGGYDIECVEEGDTVTEVLSYVHYDRDTLIAKVRKSCEDAVKAGKIPLRETGQLMANYRAGLEGYTYLE